MAIGTGLALLGSAIIGGGISLFGASQASKASTRAAGVTADAQREQLDYLKERERIPQHYRESALSKLGNIYGMPGLDGMVTESGGSAGPVSPYTDRAGFIEGVEDDPFTQLLMQEGEEGVLRGESATGGLRSGSTVEALYTARQRALERGYGRRYGEFQDYTGGISKLAQLPSNAPQIGLTMANIGKTEGQGMVASGQAWQRGIQDATEIGMGAFGTAIREGLI